MTEKLLPFSKWAKWDERDDLPNIACPGVYCIAICKTDISGSRFGWREEIVYVGMSNNKSNGVKSRLKQFDNTMRGHRGHGGAERFKFKHPNYDRLKPDLYVAIASCGRKLSENSPKDLEFMGEVVKHELVCFAKYYRRFKRLPEFNDKKRSPKKPKPKR